MNAPNILELDKSNGGRIYISRDGKPVDLELAFVDGFTVTRHDANCVLTLLANFLKARDEFSK